MLMHKSRVAPNGMARFLKSQRWHMQSSFSTESSSSSEPLLKLVQTELRGRGLVAVSPIPEGDVLFTETPLVADATLTESQIRSTCPHCFRPHSKCSQDPCLPCDLPSTATYLKALESPAFNQLVAALAAAGQEGARFPLLASKLALRCHLTDTLDNNQQVVKKAAASEDSSSNRCRSDDKEVEEEEEEEGEEEQQQQSLQDAFSALVTPKQALSASAAPPEWASLHAAAVGALEPLLVEAVSDSATRSSNSHEVLRFPWFAAALGRLHLNVMRTSEGTNGGGSSELDTSGGASGGGGGDSRGGSGGGGEGGVNANGGGTSVLYALGSFFNHGCRPNVAPIFDGACVSWHATRRIEAEEECLISYKDTDVDDQEVIGGNGGDGGNRGNGGDGGNRSGGEGAEQSNFRPTSRPESARDEFLHWNYGFRCQDSCSCGRFQLQR